MVQCLYIFVIFFAPNIIIIINCIHARSLNFPDNQLATSTGDTRWLLVNPLAGQAPIRIVVVAVKY